MGTALRNHQEKMKKVEANASMKLNSTLVFSSASSTGVCDQLKKSSSNNLFHSIYMLF